jgi:hypothetical protein
MRMKKQSQELIAEASGRSTKVEQLTENATFREVRVYVTASGPFHRHDFRMVQAQI